MKKWLPRAARPFGQQGQLLQDIALWELQQPLVSLADLYIRFSARCLIKMQMLDYLLHNLVFFLRLWDAVASSIAGLLLWLVPFCLKLAAVESIERLY